MRLTRRPGQAYRNLAYRPSYYGGHTAVLPVWIRPLFGRAFISRGNNRSWMLHLSIGPGAGSRWIDFPGYPSSVYAPRWRQRLSIGGRTWRIGRRVRDSRNESPYPGRILAWYVGPFFTRNANISVFPGVFSTDCRGFVYRL